MQRDFITRLKSRKFLSAVVYALFVLASEVLALPVSYEAYAAIGSAVGIYVISEAYVDGKAVDK